MPGNDALSILDGSTFVVSDRRGDIEAQADRPHGLFHRDTRFLCRWRLTLDGQPLDALSTDDVELEAASFFEHRLPEVFAGYARSLTIFPVEYPTASSPQAWATGTPLLLLRVLLGLEPAEDALEADPVLPEGITRLGLRGIHTRGERFDSSAPGPVGRANGSHTGERLPAQGGRS
jgi:hypothetical protein